MTSLPKHRGQHGGLIALIVLASTITVVLFTQPKKPAPPPPPVARPQATLPAPRPPEPVPPPSPAPPRDRTKVTATGKVGFDSHRTHHVDVPVYGWLQKPRASSIGRRIRAGETLGVIYSPEVYLTSVDVVEQVKNYASPDALDVARGRLLRWGMRKDQLIAIEQALKPTAQLPLIARVSGTVVAEPVTTPLVDPNAGVELFTITDPTYAVIYVDMPVADVASLVVGMPAKVTIDGMARPLTAPIGYISRRVEDGTRTVRFDLHDNALRFTPGATATIVIALASG